MDNRFMPASARPSLRGPQARRNPCYGAAARTAATLSIDERGLARAQSAGQRVLVVLIENGGIDLGIPELADRLLAALPGGDLLPDDMRQRLIVFLRDTVKKFTDDLIESAELALNRYGSAAPSLYGTVTVLRNKTATHDELRDTLWKHTREDKLVDLFVLTHGRNDEIAVGSGINGDKIRRMRADLGRPLALRSVYMMNCVGASLNQAWIDAGAKVASGTIDNNYLPEPSTLFFWQAWQKGDSFDAAITAAYRKTINLMNDAVRGMISALPIPGAALLATRVDFAKMDFVASSAPVILGQGKLTMSSDDLSFTNSLASSLATTVLPVHLLQALARAQPASLANGMSRQAVATTQSFRYHSPSMTMQWRDDVSRMQNPAAAVPLIAGIAVADAAQIGLAAAGIVQSQVNASGGSFQLVYDKAQRLLSAEARRRMPGAQKPKSSYRRHLFYVGSSSPIVDFAEANVIIEWEGNAYGEIGTPVIRRDLKTSTDWSRSSASISITQVQGLPPLADVEPRLWPLVYAYEGSFDPVGNGHFEFSGRFEINAFGSLKFLRHEVVSRSLLDFAVAGKPEDYVTKGNDVDVAVPVIPADQLEYLKGALP